MSAMASQIHCLLNCWFRHRTKKTSKLSVPGVCVGNSPMTGEFPAQRPVTRKMFLFHMVTSSWYDEFTYLCDLFPHIPQGCVIGTGPVVKFSGANKTIQNERIKRDPKYIYCGVSEMLREVWLLRVWKHQPLFLRDIHCANYYGISVYPILWPFKNNCGNAMFIYEIYHFSDVIMTLRRPDCVLNRLFRHKSKKTSQHRVTGLQREIHRWPVDFLHRRGQ